MTKRKTKILILVSNPTGTSNIDVLPEVRNVEEALRRGQYRERLEIIWKVAVKQEDLRRHILDVKPQIIHFCGHGTTEGLILEDDKGQRKPVSNEFLVDLLRIYDTRIECVLFNACDSQVLAQKASEHLNYAIGMSQPVKDKAAIAFSQAFYDGLGAGELIEKAFEFGKNAVLGQISSDNARMREFVAIDDDNNPIESGNREHLIPNLYKNPDPQEIKPLWLNPEEEHQAVRELLQEIENRDNKIRLFHTEKPIILKDQYIPIQVTLERRYQHTVETTRSYGESEEELKRIYALKGIGESEIKRQQEDWHKAKQNQSRIVVLADPGMGKSTLLRTELCTVVEESYQALNNRQPAEEIVIPLLIRLSTLAEKIAEMPVEEAIINIIQERHSNILINNEDTNVYFLNDFLKQQLLDGKCLLLLDALDEVPQEKRFQLLEKLNNFVRAYPNCQIIATSRIVGYGGKLVDDAKEMEIVPFNQEKTEQYIQTWFNNAREYLQDTSVTAEGLIQALRERPQIGGLAQNPLLLSLICSLYQQDKLRLPFRRGEIYRQSVNYMLAKWNHDNSRKSANEATVELKTEQLEELAYRFSCQGKEVFTLRELRHVIKNDLGKNDNQTSQLINELSEQDGILQKLNPDSNEQYLFLHRTFQEYFTASYLNQKIEEKPRDTINLVKKNLWNYDWHETLTLLAGLMENPIILINEITNERDDIFKTQLLLAGRCIAECPEISHPLIDKTIERIYKFWLIYPELDFISSVFVAIGQTHAKLVQKLIKALQDKYSDVRRNVAEALGNIGDKAAVEPLIKALQHEDSDVRRYAASALGNIGDKAAVEPLIKALQDENYYVRRNAASALGNIGDKAAVEPLIKALHHEDSFVRSNAAEALGNIGDKAAVEPLIKALQDENYYVRRDVASALAKIGDKAAVEPLIKALQDEDSYVRSNVASALAKIGDKAAVEPLIKALQDEDSYVRSNVASALAKIGDKAAVELLIKALQDEDSYVRSNAAEALAKIGDKAAVEPLINALQDENSDVIRNAASALGNIGDKAAVEPLIKALQDEDSDVIRNAASALGNIGDKAAVEPLIKALQDWDFYVRSNAASALAKIGSSSGLKKLLQSPLINIFDSEIFPVARSWAIRQHKEGLSCIPVYPKRINPVSRLVLASHQVGLPKYNRYIGRKMEDFGEKIDDLYYDISNLL